MSAADESLAERRERLSRNELLFRVINERMRELNETFAAVTDDEFAIVCECSCLTCVRQMIIPRVEYDRVRTDPTLFIVLPGHEDTTVETVVEDDRGASYLVVRKHLADP